MMSAASANSAMSVSSVGVLGNVTSARAQAVLRRLELAISRRLDGLVSGDYLGLTPGAGRELAEAREYSPGEDDVRRLDWAVTARTTVPHVRDETADHELETWALIDATSSMDFGTAVAPSPRGGDGPGGAGPGGAGLALEKRELAVAAVGALGLLTARGGNRMGAVVLTNTGLRRIPARSGRPALLGLLRQLLDLPRLPAPSGRGAEQPSVADAVTDLTRSLGQRGRRVGLVAVVSDFLDSSGSAADGADAVLPWTEPLRRLSMRAPLLAVEILDPRELELPDMGMLSLVDPETGQRRDIWTSPAVRQRYAEAAAEQRNGIRIALKRCRARHLQLRTDRDWLRDLARFALDAKRLPLRAGAR